MRAPSRRPGLAASSAVGIALLLVFSAWSGKEPDRAGFRPAQDDAVIDSRASVIRVAPRRRNSPSGPAATPTRTASFPTSTPTPPSGFPTATPTPTGPPPTNPPFPTATPTSPPPPTSTPTSPPTGGTIIIRLRAVDWQFDWIGVPGQADGGANATLHRGQKYELHVYNGGLPENPPHQFSGITGLGLSGAVLTAGAPDYKVTFTPNTTGTFPYLCTDSQCGTGHDNMTGIITIVP